VTRRVVGGGRGRHAVGAGTTDPGRQELAQLAADVEGLRDEVTALRRELDDNQNRLDFTERLLAQAKERGLLSAPKEP
jgi:cell division protein FtsB